MKLAETCACGAQFSVDDTFHSAFFVYEKLDEWRRLHPCRAGELEEALREITQTDWHSEGWSKETPFQFEQRIHKIAADALMSTALQAKERE